MVRWRLKQHLPILTIISNFIENISFLNSDFLKLAKTVALTLK